MTKADIDDALRMFFEPYEDKPEEEKPTVDSIVETGSNEIILSVRGPFTDAQGTRLCTWLVRWNRTPDYTQLQYLVQTRQPVDG